LAESGITRIWPVNGFIAFLALPEQTTAPLLQPGT
jgi:hypothetical protein